MEYKNYNIVPGAFANKAIKALGKGSVNKSLRGLYTSEREAQVAIDLFESQKAKQNGKTKSSD
jgi:hypothetical protein